MKMLAAIVGVLALGALSAVPAAAQSAGDSQYEGGQDECVKGLIVRATGTLEKPDATSYGYGTHSITDEQSGCFFALQSETVELDDYVGEKVEIAGTTVRGYPLEGGPVLLNVSEVERVHSGDDGNQNPDGPGNGRDQYEDPGNGGDQYDNPGNGGDQYGEQPDQPGAGDPSGPETGESGPGQPDSPDSPDQTGQPDQTDSPVGLLPDTGGAPLVFGLLGLMLIGGGLAFRRLLG